MVEERIYDDIEPDEAYAEIDWTGLFLKLIRNWKFISIFSVSISFLGILVALVMPREYTVAVTLAPEAQGRGASGNLGGIASMLGVGGGGLSSAGDALNISLFPQISSSTLFLTQLFDVEVTPYVSPKSVNSGELPAETVTLYKYITKDGETPGLIKTIKKSLFSGESIESDTLIQSQLTKKQYAVVKKLRKVINAEVDKKSGITTIRVTMDDPWIATSLADTVCNRLQNYVIAYRTKKASTDLNYYEKLADDAKQKMIKAQSAYAASVDFDRSVILQSVRSERDRLQQEAQLANQLYSQMQQQVEMAKAKLQEEKPVYAVIQPATMPDRPVISRKSIVLAFAFLGFLFAVVWKLIGEDFFEGFINQIKNRMAAEKAAEKTI